MAFDPKPFQMGNQTMLKMCNNKRSKNPNFLFPFLYDTEHAIRPMKFTFLL